MDKHPNVLIIDDMVINQMLLSSQLGALHVECDLCSSGEEGLKKYEENAEDYDLILVDLHMPGMDGYETFDRLREIFKQKGRSVPVVCETADDAPEATTELINRGFSEVLVKPLDFRVLHDMLKRRLGDQYSVLKDTAPKTDPNITAAIDELPDWIKDVEGLDLKYGVEHCGGTAQDYMDALCVFAASIDEKATDIQHYLDVHDQKMQVLRIHSLKSVARLVGALSLAEQAAALEAAAKVGNTDVLESGTKTLIEHYRQIEAPLKENLGNAAGKSGPLPPISEATLTDAYSAIEEFTHSYDIDDVGMVLHSLSEYDLPTEDAVRLERLKIAHRKMDWEAIRSIVAEKIQA